MTRPTKADHKAMANDKTSEGPDHKAMANDKTSEGGSNCLRR